MTVHTLKNKTVLIVDDNDGIVASLTMLLEYGGYNVDSIMNGLDAKKIQAPYPSPILLDIWMTGINGLTVCKYLKSQPATKHIPIIMVSAYPGSATKAFEAGTNDFIDKPYALNQVLLAVEKYIL